MIRIARFSVASLLALGLIARGGEKPAEHDDDRSPAPSAAAPAAAAVPGKVIEVKTISDDRGNRFEPAEIEARPGDILRITNVSGVHNISCLAVLYDFAAISLLQFTGSGEPGRLLVALLALNPIDGVRALALTGLGADVLLGPTGAAVQRLLGAGGGAALILLSLLLSCLLPLSAGRAVYGRRDF